VEGKIKPGRQIYVSPDSYVPTVVHSPGVDFQKDFMFMPCLAMDKVRKDLQPRCVSIVIPDTPEVVIRDNGQYVEGDFDYNPQNPETFDMDASYVWSSGYFPGYYKFESVSTPGKFQLLMSDGKIAMVLFEDTDEFRNAASFDVPTHSTQRTYAHRQFFQIVKLYDFTLI